MIIKATLLVLIILLVAVIAASYYVNKEAFENMTVEPTKYVFYVNRYNEPTGTPVCLSTLAGGKVGISNKCDSTSPKQIWYFNQDGNLLTDDPDYKDKCLQLNADGSLTLNTCTLNSTQFSYTDNKLMIKGSSPTKCVNLVKGLYEDGSLVNAIECTQARSDTVTWFAKIVPLAASTVSTPASTPTMTGIATVTPTATPTSTPAASGTGATVAGTGTVPQNNTIVADTTVSETTSNAKALQEQMSILKNIQELLKNQTLSARITEVSTPSGSVSAETSSTQQGKEYESSCYKDQMSHATNSACPATPDMAKYIKKDQIPCWGCNLDY